MLVDEPYAFVSFDEILGLRGISLCSWRHGPSFLCGNARVMLQRQSHANCHGPLNREAGMPAPVQPPLISRLLRMARTVSGCTK